MVDGGDTGGSAKNSAYIVLIVFQVRGLIGTGDGSVPFDLIARAKPEGPRVTPAFYISIQSFLLRTKGDEMGEYGRLTHSVKIDPLPERTGDMNERTNKVTEAPREAPCSEDGSDNNSCLTSCQ
jgi:hypothetical protein